MRNNIVRVIFVIIVIGLVAFAAYYLNRNDETPLSDANVIDDEEGSEDITNIRVGIAELDNLNPILSKNQKVQDISKLIYEPLLSLTENYKLENTLVTQWTNIDNKTYMVKIRGGIKWHNNSDFVAKDVKFTVEKIKELGNDSIYYANVRNIEDVEIVGGNFVKFYLYEEEPFFEYNLSFPIICESFFAGEDIRNTEKNKIPMGTGMFKINAVDLNSQIELKANPYWWNLKNVQSKIDKITVKIYFSTSELYNAYKMGSIDLLTTAKHKNIEEFIGKIGFNTKECSGREYDYLALNTRSSVTSNKEVRYAINYAINKQDIINSVYEGKYIAADYPLSYGSYLYDSNNNNYEHNPEKAKQILNENGWGFDGKYWQKMIGGNHIRLKIDLLVDSNHGKRVDAANKIREQLESIGIQVNVIAQRDKNYDKYLSSRSYDMLLTGVTIGIAPKLNRYFGDGNFANYYNEEIRNILEEIKSIENEDVMHEKYSILQKTYMDERIYIGLYFNGITTIYAKNLSGNVSPTWYNIYNHIETWSRKR